MRPPVSVDREPGEWSHGWQFHASTARDKFFAKSVCTSRCSPTERALLFSQSGCLSGRWLIAVPYPNSPSAMSNKQFLTALRRRLRVPLLTVDRSCEGTNCTSKLDLFGDHRSSCMSTGRVQKRGADV